MTLNATKLNEIATKIRKSILKITCEAESGHPGGSLSATDIITALYFHKMRHRPNEPHWPGRDRFILSKGHAAPALYSALAIAGYFHESELMTLRKLNTRLQGHPVINYAPGIENSSGPVGQGLSFGNGVAIAGRLDKLDYKTYVMLGDGEIQEGQIWEAAMFASHYKLNNLVAILDYNGLQTDGTNAQVKGIEPLSHKWSSFGWNPIEIDGHDFNQILSALDTADKVIDRPTIIIANTLKGKGVKSMEGKLEWHGKACSLNDLPRYMDEIQGPQNE